MNIKNKRISITQAICLGLYYGFARILPSSKTPVIGKVCKSIRFFLVKRIFKECGKNVNVEHGARFESGLDVCIGDNSGIGVNCTIPGNTIIGKNVMMAPNCYFFAKNHEFSRIDIPMIQQGFTEKKQTVIGDDVWIGRNVTVTPGRVIADHSIIAANCCLTKDYPPLSIIGGNPSRLIRTRTEKHE